MSLSKPSHHLSSSSSQISSKKPSLNPYDDLKTALLQPTQPSVAERVQKLLQQECVGNFRVIALLNEIKLLAPREFRDKPVNHSVTHSITNHGNPVKARVRRLSPTRYKIARDEFEHMLDLGNIRRSSSNWSSTYHLVPKKSGDWRPCGDYRALNSITVPDDYPTPNIQDFSSNLRTKKVVSKIDLVRIYNQILMAEADIPKPPLPPHLLKQPAFKKFKTLLIDWSVPAHQGPEAILTLFIDTSQVAVGAVLEQGKGDVVQPLAFFSAKLTPPQALYSTFERVYKAVENFWYLLERQKFMILTDHKPLAYASRASSDRYSPCKTQHLNCILQFINDIRHVKDAKSLVGGCLSRTDVEATIKFVDFRSKRSEINQLLVSQKQVCQDLLSQNLSDAKLSNLSIISRSLAIGQQQNWLLIVLSGHLFTRTSRAAIESR
ncbi:unnamed protein product [Hymenolepis diminuta]|uniref:RT_RNaseH domain-containing protein n=1 Tax=Hymenolepis diminuta TaxID=6216 RepID=A0A0R3SQ65_HYMDI|nr:unnamed protein product [Hymenolepis diminuta]